MRPPLPHELGRWGQKEGPPTSSLEQHLHPYLAGLPLALPPGLFAAPPVSLEALVPSPSPPGGGGAEAGETE